MGIDAVSTRVKPDEMGGSSLDSPAFRLFNGDSYPVGTPFEQAIRDPRWLQAGSRPASLAFSHS